MVILLLNHINIIVSSCCRSRRGNLLRLIRDSGLVSSASTGIGRTAPVVLHLLVEFLLCLAGPAVRSTLLLLLLLLTVSAIPVVAALATTSSTVTSTACWGTLAGNVAVNVVRGRLGYVAATDRSSSAATATSASTTFCAVARAFRAQTARVAWPLDTVEKASSGSLHIVEWVAVSSSSCAASSGDYRQADRLSFGVCAVEFGNGGFGITEALVGHIGDSLGASSTVVDQSQVEDWSNSSE